jgi:S1-C subfamily serine protease
MIDFNPIASQIASNMTSKKRPASLLCPLAVLLFFLLSLLFPDASWAQSQAAGFQEASFDATQSSSPKRFFSGQISQTGVIPEPQLEAIPQPDNNSNAPGIVGLDLVVRPHSYPFVKDVLEGTPADDQGIASGDYIVAVNGASTFGKTRVQVDDQIPDKPGTPITFQIQRQGQLYQVRVTVASLRQLPLTTQNFFMSP